MPKPSWKFEWNPNTFLQLAQILMLIGGGAWYVATQQAGQERNADRIGRVEQDVGRLQTNAAAYSNIEFRIKRLEDGFIGVTANTRDLEKTINGMASDIRVMREILDRLDKLPDQDTKR